MSLYAAMTMHRLTKMEIRFHRYIICAEKEKGNENPAAITRFPLSQLLS